MAIGARMVRGSHHGCSSWPVWFSARSFAAALQIDVLAAAAEAAPVSKLVPDSAQLPSEAGTRSADPAATNSDNPGDPGYAVDRFAAPSVDDFPVIRAVGDVFHSREFELDVLDDRYKPFSGPGSCLYPGTTVRGFGESAEDCRFIKPGKEESDFFNLTLLALSGWVFVILAIAGLQYFYGYWRVRRWLRRMRAAGLIPKTVNLRRSVERGARRSSSRRASRPRKYAGRVG